MFFATDGTIKQPAIDRLVLIRIYSNKNSSRCRTTADTVTINTVVTGKTTASKLKVSALAAVTASDSQWPGTGLTKEQVGYLLF